MKKIFGDEIVSKLRAIPSAVWVLILYSSFFFAHAYEFMLDGEYYSAYIVKTITETYGENSGIALNPITIGIFYTLFEPLLKLIIFEAIGAIAYRYVAGRYGAQINRTDYKFRLRYLIIVCNLIIGVLSIGYFFTQFVDGVITPDIKFYSGSVNSLKAQNPYYYIQDAILPFAVYSAACLLFYEDFRARFVPKRTQAPLFKTFALFYLGICAAIFVYNTLSTFALYANTTVYVYEIIAYSLRGAFILAAAIAYYFYYRQLKNNESHDDDVHFEIHEPDDNGGSDTIFTDFGF